METVIGVENYDEGKFEEIGIEKSSSSLSSPKGIADPVVYKLVRVYSLDILFYIMSIFLCNVTVVAFSIHVLCNMSFLFLRGHQNVGTRRNLNSVPIDQIA